MTAIRETDRTSRACRRGLHGRCGACSCGCHLWDAFLLASTAVWLAIAAVALYDGRRFAFGAAVVLAGLCAWCLRRNQQ